MSTLSRWAAALTVLVVALGGPALAGATPSAGASALQATAGAATAKVSTKTLGEPSTVARRTQLGIRVRSISAGGEHTCAVGTDSSLWCWGRNTYGQLGIKRSGPYAVAPEQLGGRTAKWKQVSAGGASTCAIRQDGSLWCWGVNHRGQLGTGNTTSTDRPKRVGTSKKWKSVSVGYSHTCAIRQDGSLWCWGENNSGQLGTKSKSSPKKPAKVGKGPWKKVAVGGWHTCAIKKQDGSLWCWGRNGFGQVGNGGYGDVRKPARIGNDGWRSVAVSWTHTCGITKSGEARCWGRNLEGQLGDGTTTVSPVPRTVAGQPTPSQIAVNEGTSCLLSSAKSVWCWGSNSYGAFGEGALPDSARARKAKRLGGLHGLSSGWLHSCAIDSGQHPVCWGNNERGQTGVVPPELAAPTAARATRRTPAAAQRKDGALDVVIASMNALGNGHSRPYADADHFAPARVRAEWTFEAADALGASVVGLQEPTAEQLESIVTAGDGAWEVYPTPDEGDRRVESPLAWRTDQWEAVEKTTIRTQFINRQLARPVVKLRHRVTGREMYVINVHNAPWQYQAKRNAAVKVELAKIQELEATGLPVFFVGDMNEKRTIVCKVLTQTGLVSPGGGRIAADGSCVTPKVMRVDWIFGPATATYTGFTHSRHSMVRLVTDHWVPVVRATIP
jgi:alpha-tubulin suppressor-like RCC1 family protein/endonuclease/exonuclease/phosphatase family metal-dependent hydrolase